MPIQRRPRTGNGHKGILFALTPIGGSLLQYCRRPSHANLALGEQNDGGKPYASHGPARKRDKPASLALPSFATALHAAQAGLIVPPAFQEHRFRQRGRTQKTLHGFSLKHALLHWVLSL